jgi:hypothetical protein
MAIYNIRYKDVARILSTGTKTLDEVKEEINKLYPKLKPDKNWIPQVLVDWNPLVTKKEGKI